jgi:multidrug resistance efflux pump
LSSNAVPDSPLITLLALARRARQAKDPAELQFVAVNDSHTLAPYRQGVLWFAADGVKALSGVVQAEANVPYVQWLNRACTALREQGGGARQVTAADLSDAEAADWAEWLPAFGLCVPLAGTDGVLLLARDTPWQERDVALLAEWLDIWRHAWLALARPGGWSWRDSPQALARYLRPVAGRAWWKQKAVLWSAAALAALLFPVRLTVLAPGELVPSDPAVIRAPFDGVVAGFLIKPNDAVKAGQPLFTFDDATLVSRLEVARQALGTAEAELRQASQQALADAKYKSQLVVLSGKIEERRAEAGYLQGQLERSRVLAPRDGVALFDDPSEWLGKPVVTGERILRVAAADQVEVEAWLAVGDAIPLAAGAPATLYLNASPLSPVSSTVRYVAHDAMARPDGSYAYRVRAVLDDKTRHRVGLKGTVKLAGGWVPLGYWVLRRPLAAIRQFVGW